MLLTLLTFLQDARHSAEGEIYTKLNQKIDEFIQLADYEWNMTESDGRASGYLMDLINFLRSTFQVFTHLPVSFVHMNSFEVSVFSNSAVLFMIVILNCNLLFICLPLDSHVVFSIYILFSSSL